MPGAAEDPKDVRQQPRTKAMLVAMLRAGDADETLPVHVRNLSSGGMMVEGHPQLEPGDPVELDVAGVGKVSGTIAWTEAGRAGVAFLRPINPARAILSPPVSGSNQD